MLKTFNVLRNLWLKVESPQSETVVHGVLINSNDC